MGAGVEEEKILVLVRLRPLNEKEIVGNNVSDWECISDQTILFRNPLQEKPIYPTAYTFDRVFRSDCSTRKVYDEGVKDVALAVMGGINSTVFAYGQTSSGKTHTMSGITELAVADIHDYIQKHEEREFVLKFSAMEIHNENVRDLLSTETSPIPLRLLDDPEKGIIVEKLMEETLRDWNHLKELLSLCESQRQTGETYLNETSSRSHQILRMTVESSAREFLGRDSSTTLAATVNFVDLAGSERASQSFSVGARLKEGCHINRSLLTLGTVIRKLSKGRRSSHVNYRDSKLTRILQTSLGGNSRTAIICTMSPARCHVEQSRNTLLFASCAKEVSTDARVNVVMSDKALVKHLRREVARLETELRIAPPCSTTAAVDHTVLLRKKDFQIEKMEEEIRCLVRQRDLAQSRLADLINHLQNDVAQDPPPTFAGVPATRHTLENGVVPSTRHALENGVVPATRNALENGVVPATRHALENGVVPVTRHARENGVVPAALHVRESGVVPATFRVAESEVVSGTRFEAYKDVQCVEVASPVECCQSTGVLSPSVSARRSAGSCGETETELSPASVKTPIEEDRLHGWPQRRRRGRLVIPPLVYDGGSDCGTLASSSEGSTEWSVEFVGKRNAIVRLWDACDISLVHRTYFFLLVRGDPADSAYVEVELRKLSFLREALRRGDDGGGLASVEASARSLRREREMLCRQVGKRLSESERVELYRRWGIGPEMKRRKARLVSLLWRNTEDMDHIERSAAVVAKLVSFSNERPGLKAMSGLTFTPPRRNKNHNRSRLGSFFSS